MNHELCRGRGVAALIGLPVYHEGKIAGVLELRFDRLDAFQEHDVRTCQLMAGLVTEAISRAAELDWKHALAAERATMLDALERIRPQLARLAGTGASAEAEREEATAPLNSVESASADNSQAPFEPEQIAAEPSPEAAPPKPAPATVSQPASPAAPVSAQKPADTQNPVTSEKKEAACRSCGHQFEADEYFCGFCGTARWMEQSDGSIQSKWASLWRLQQKSQQASGKTSHPDEDDAVLDLSPEAIAKMAVQFTSENLPGTLRPRKQEPPARQDSSEPVFPADLEEIVGHYSADGDETTAASTDAIEPVPGDYAHEQGSIRIVPVESTNRESAPAYPWTSARKARQWLESLSGPQPSRTSWPALWHQHRANVYLGMAFLILVTVLMGWGTAPAPPSPSDLRSRLPSPPQLTFFEHILVSLGLAVPPPVPAYLGNPDTRVWVDEKTALYYCPGADLYGTTSQGKYTTQRDAQQDQFQPAYRRACD